MRAPLSRTPICLDTVCCRLDNRRVSLSETGAATSWRDGSASRCQRGTDPTCLPRPSCRLSPVPVTQTSACSVMLVQEWVVHYLYHLYRDTTRFFALKERKKLIPCILFPIELNRFLIESLLLWVIDLTVWAN